MKNMNKSMQVKTIQNLLKKKGYDPDLYDVYSMVDSTLTLRENWNEIQEDIKLMIPVIKIDTGLNTKSLSKTERYVKALDLFNARSFRRKIKDQLKQAVVVFDASDLNKQNFNKWKKNPNRYDIEGIDTKY